MANTTTTNDNQSKLQGVEYCEKNLKISYDNQTEIRTKHTEKKPMETLPCSSKVKDKWQEASLTENLIEKRQI